MSLTNITKLVVELPERSGLSRRLYLDGTEVQMLPLICALGANSGADAAVSSSYPVLYGGAADATSGTGTGAYFDLPIGANADEEIRITIGVTTAADFKFSALMSVANRNLVWDVSSLGDATRTDYTFRSDVKPFAIAVGAAETAADSGAAYTFQNTVTNGIYIDEINFDGNPRYTYDDCLALNVEFDKVITSTVSLTSVGRDAQVKGIVFTLVPTGVRKINVESATTADRWVVAVYTTTAVSA
jgi:hypothetical protein